MSDRTEARKAAVLTRPGHIPRDRWARLVHDIGRTSFGGRTITEPVLYCTRHHADYADCAARYHRRRSEVLDLLIKGGYQIARPVTCRELGRQAHAAGKPRKSPYRAGSLYDLRWCQGWDQCLQAGLPGLE